MLNLKNDRADIALRYIKKGTTPYEYIADKLRNYKVVAIGEDHWIAEPQRVPFATYCAT